jgi:hypothetical protein
MQGVRARLMEHVPLGETGLSVPLSGGLCEVWRRDVVGIDRVAIRAMGASPGLGTGGGAGQCRVVPQLGKQGEMALPRHGQGVVVAAVPVEPHGGPGDHPGDQGQQGVEQGGDAAELRGTCGVSCGGGSCCPLDALGDAWPWAVAASWRPRWPCWPLAPLRSGRPAQRASAPSAGPGRARVTGCRRPVLAPACPTGWHSNDRGQRCASRLWWPRLHRPPAGRPHQHGRQADDSTPNTAWPTGAPERQSAGRSGHCRRDPPSGRCPTW